MVFAEVQPAMRRQGGCPPTSARRWPAASARARGSLAAATGGTAALLLALSRAAPPTSTALAPFPRLPGAVHFHRGAQPPHGGTAVQLGHGDATASSPAWRAAIRSVRRRPQLGGVELAALGVTAADLREAEGVVLSELTPERLEAVWRLFPGLHVSEPGIQLISEDPPVLLLEDVLDADECEAFIESMRGKDGKFPERLGQSNLPALPSWMDPVKTALRGVPVLDWLGNPTVRWTYKSRRLLNLMLDKVKSRFGLEVKAGAANIKHYREGQWLPVHIDYNHATLLTYLSDVEEGGETFFPTLGIKVKARKGSAVVWPNQPPLEHAGERVVRGEKWIIFYNWPAEQNWEYDDNFEFND